MNEGAVSRVSDWVWRRWEQPLSMGGHELPPYSWLIILGVVLTAAFFYVGWMYIKDSRSVGPWWATLLGLLRSTVYIILAVVFMLPSQANFEETSVQYKYMTMYDTSDSHLFTYDDPITRGGPQLSRQDKVYNLLTDPKVNFHQELSKKNPLTVYRFAAWADEDYIYLDQGHFYTRAEWEKKLQAQPRFVPTTKGDLLSSPVWKKWAFYIGGGAVLVLGLLVIMARYSSFSSRYGSERATQWALVVVVLGAGSWLLYQGYNTRTVVEEKKTEEQVAKAAIEARPLPDAYLDAFLRAKEGQKVVEKGSKVNQDQKDLNERIKLNNDLRKKGFFDGTSVGDSALALFNREQNNRVLGIVLFSDGHSTLGSSQSEQELVKRAKANNIPIFVVGIGENRPHVKTEVVEVKAPAQARPEDKFAVSVEISGQGLADKEIPVELVITHTRLKNGKEEPQPLRLLEITKNKNDDASRERIDLGSRITLKQKVKLDRSSPPHATAEFKIDAPALLEAVGKSLSGDQARKKWGLDETPDGSLQFNVRVPKDVREIVNPKETYAVNRRPTKLRVEEKKLRVLLFASAPTREYQFLRTLLVREMQSKRLDLSIHLQLPPGTATRRSGPVLQDVPPEQLLDTFPNTYGEGGKNKLYDLASYDVIVAFDPDWGQLSPEQLLMLAGDEQEKRKGWVDRGGGLIVVAGPINTIQLARPTENKNIQLIRNLYPVVPADYRIDDDDRDTKDPHALTFPDASPEMNFLRLDESDPPKKLLNDWKEFFYGASAVNDKIDPLKVPERGFYNFFPVEKVKAGSLVIARYLDDNARMKDRDHSFQPFMVATDKASGRRVVWLGAGETWRLRSYKESFHERFWIKLIRYAGAISNAKIDKHMELVVTEEQKVGQPIRIEAHIESDNGKPLGDKVKPVLKIEPPVGVQGGQTVVYNLIPRKGRDGWFIPEKEVKVPSSGKYGLELSMPGTKETDHVWVQATTPNLEKEETQPDFRRLYYLASEAQEVLDRMTNENDKRLLRESLQVPNLTDSAGEQSVLEGKRRLFFTLKNAHLIPKCLKGKPPEKVKTRLPYKDLWDEGWSVGEYRGKPVKLSWVLCIVVGLLSLEWLTRKLLRLA